MSHIPLLSDEQMRNLGRILGAGHTINLYNSTAKGQRRTPPYDNNVNGLPSSEVVFAKVTAGNAESGYNVELYANGLNYSSTGSGILFLPEVALNGTIPAGSIVLAHYYAVTVTGGNE